MRLYFKDRTPGQVPFGILYGGIALLALSAARFLPCLTFLPSCPVKALTGLPCPTCGSAHSVVYLAHGDVLSSIVANPLTSLCFIAAVLYFSYSLVTLSFHTPRIGIFLTEKEKDVVRVGAVLFVLVNWMYLVFAF